MFLIFPIAYLLSFVYGLTLLLKKQITGFLVFCIVGLPMYAHVLSVSFEYGFGRAIPLLQGLKEIMLVLALIVVLTGLKQKPKLHLVDKLMAVFFIGSFIYLLLPIGNFGFLDRLSAFRTLCTFSVIYFLGRFCRAETINLNKIFSYVTLMAVVTALFILFEVITDTHLHSRTGYTDFQIQYYNGYVSGNYGLTWTFEAENGMKRFGSIYTNPLEMANGAILALAAFLAISSFRKYRLNQMNFYAVSFMASFICIIFAISRAAFANYFIVIYFYAWLTLDRKLVKYFHYCVVAVFIYVAFFLRGGLFELVITTLNFESSSSMGHVIEWAKGINAMITNPLGLGLGASGKVAGSTNDNVGGENQLIIVGVQVGVILMLVYAWIYAQMIITGIRAFRRCDGKKKRLILFVVVAKTGLIIPLLTAYLDSSLYVTYLIYFMSGLMINVITAKATVPVHRPSTLITGLTTPQQGLS